MKKSLKSDSPLLQRAYRHGRSKFNSIILLDQGDDALLARIHMIRNAQRSIDIQTFIWKRDAVGVKVLKELFDAARRGVRVRLLIDYWFFTKDKRIMDFLNVNHRNFDVKLYNPPHKKLHNDFLDILGQGLIDFKRVNQRMHNKLFIVDNAIVVTGGRNYDNTYYDRGETRNFLDMDVLFWGPESKKAIQSFRLFWQHPYAIDVNHLKDVKDNSLQGCCDLINEENNRTDKNIFDELNELADDMGLWRDRFLKRIVRCQHVEYIYDKPGKTSARKSEKVSETTLTLRALTREAKKTILIQSPYFVLSDGTVRLIKELRRNKKKLDFAVSTNSLAATDNLYAYAMLYKDMRIYIKDLKIRLFEMKPVPEDLPGLVERSLLPVNIKTKKVRSFLNDKGQITREHKYLCIHAKMFVVDDRWAWVGSYNADIRSEMINTENAVIIKSPKIAKRIGDKIKKIIRPQNSWTVAPKQYVPVLTEVNDELTLISNALPIIDLWPFRNVTCFELRDGAHPVSIFHKDFYKNYRPVGPFPQITARLKDKEIKIQLLKTFGKIIKPVV